MPILNDSYAILDRAQRDLNALEGKIAAYLDRKPHELVMEPNDKRTLYEVRLKETEAPDSHWGIDFGVIGIHLRSALDYLASYFASPADPELSAAQFPISESETEYLRGKRSYRDRSLRGVPDDLWPLFDQQQPYVRGDDPDTGPLAILVWMTNGAKHRKIRPVSGTVHNANIGVYFDDVHELDVLIQSGRMFGPGISTKADYLFGVTPGSAHQKAEVKGQLTLGVAFGYRDRAFGTPEVQPVIDRVREIVDLFDPLAPVVA